MILNVRHKYQSNLKQEFKSFAFMSFLSVKKGYIIFVLLIRRPSCEKLKSLLLSVYMHQHYR